MTQPSQSPQKKAQRKAPAGAPLGSLRVKPRVRSARAESKDIMEPLSGLEPETYALRRRQDRGDSDSENDSGSDPEPDLDVAQNLPKLTEIFLNILRVANDPCYTGATQASAAPESWQDQNFTPQSATSKTARLPASDKKESNSLSVKKGGKQSGRSN